MCPQITAQKYLVQAGWADIPHLDEKTKRELLASTPPHLVAARTQGVPSLGSGAIYPISLEEFVIDPFEIPKFWPRVYGLDVGWNRTACIWGAIERETDILHLYTEHYRAHAEPSAHVTAIKARGDWIPGVIDPGARASGAVDGKRLLYELQLLGLNLTLAVNARESGIFSVHERLSTGRIKVFRSMRNWQAEYRLYRRDKKGKVVKKFDHAMDATRYLVVSGIILAKTQPAGRTFLPPSLAEGLSRAGY